MTGHGEAFHRQDGMSLAVEVRTVNSRYFKISVRSSEGYSQLDPQIEEVVRSRIRRGTIQVNMRIERLRTADEYRINPAVLGGYRDQIRALHQQLSLSGEVALESLLLLPGVVEDLSGSGVAAETDWPLIARTLHQAIDNLERMRSEEGRAMAEDLAANARSIATDLSAIRQRSPQVVANYRGRLEERVRKVLEEYSLTLDPTDLIREVSLFTERSDISEEVVRLQSHLDQFALIAALPESSGRKLEFLIQEMFREANTIGSKGNDVEISQRVIEIKTAIERMREMIQNVE